MVFGTIFRRPVNDVAHEAAFVGAVFFACWLLWYCLHESRTRTPLPEVGLRRLVTAGISAVILAVGAVTPFGSIEAAVLERRLLRLISGKVEKKQIYEAQKIISTAEQNRITLDSRVLSKVARIFLDANIEDPAAKRMAWEFTAHAIELPHRAFLVREFPAGGLQQKAIPGQRIVNQTVILDDGIWRDVIFDHCVVVYRGGGVSLLNVEFTEGNRFFISKTKMGEQLAAELINSILMAEYDPAQKRRN